MGKDPLCPLGFHPQVRWPTRCKRCFREFKEHTVTSEATLIRARSYDREAAKTSETNSSFDDAASTPSRPRPLSSTAEDKDYSSPYSSISSAALTRLNKYREEEIKTTPVSVVSETLTLPSGDGPLLRRRKTTDLCSIAPEEKTPTETVTIKLRRTPSINSASDEAPPCENTSGSFLPQRNSSQTTVSGDSAQGDGNVEGGIVKPKKTKKKRLLIQGVQEVISTPPDSNSFNEEDESSSADVAFIIQVKSTGKKKKTDDDDETMSLTTATDTTETTLVDLNESSIGGMSSWEAEEMKTELKRLKEKCDKLEKEKGEILSRRVASLDAPRAQSSEYVKLQQKVNQLSTINEDLKDEQKHLEARVRELESDLSNRPTVDFMQRSISELRSKLSQAEHQIDQLEEEKRDAIRQMQDMQEEFEEMQDSFSFREEQSVEFATLKKEMDEASKNCRLLQFKLRKVEKKCDQLEAEKKEVEQRLEKSSSSGKVAKLEEDLRKLKQENERLKSKEGLSPSIIKKKSPVLTKAPSGEKVDPPMSPDFDPHKTLRDLQSALERESDLREQYKFVEEEAGALRQKISRIEEENESLLIQIKKMSAKSRVDKGRAETGRLGQHSSTVNNDVGDANELKLQLELNEQESQILRKKVEALEKSNTKFAKDLQKAEEKLQVLENSSPVIKSKNVEEVSLLRRKLIEKEREIERLQTEMLSVTTKNKGKIFKNKALEAQESTLESKTELKKVQEELTKLKTVSEEQRIALEDELQKALKDVDSHQIKVQQITESNRILSEQIEGLKRDMKRIKDHYESTQEEFQAKYSQLSSEKEELRRESEKLREEYSTIDRELRTLRETFNIRQDTWIKEKLVLEQKLRDMEDSAKKFISIPGDKDATKLKTILKQQQSDLDKKAKEFSECQERIIQMQKDNEELKRQLEDFDKLAQVQLRSLSSEPSKKSNKEIQVLQEKLSAEEKHHKNEIVQLKMKQDQELALKTEEIASIQSQFSRAKRERDTYRQMVDSAQRAIAELKSRGSNSGSRGSVTGLEEAATGQVAAMRSLQDRCTSLEDELAEARREASHAKTEIITEKSQWEMIIGEKQQKINELEEEKLLSGSSRTRGSGAINKTRLELAWQKEREEQQRRLKEATTLARDLKTTLLEIERERDRDRMEAKRRIEQLKATMEEEQEEVKRKLGESQNDLLELRDAHAKLRTANEKLRKDREKLESQREAQIKKELEIRKVRLEREKLLDQLLTRVAALNPTSSNSNLAQQAPKLSFAEVLHFLQNIKSLIEPDDLTNPREKRRSHFKKASSLGENDDPGELQKSKESLASMPGGYGLKDYYGAAGRSQKPYSGSTSSSTLTLPSRTKTSGPSLNSSSSHSSHIRSNASDSGATSAATFNPRGSLYRKALSLEQTVSMPDEQKIWKGNSEAGSGSSLTSIDGQFSRGSSMERTSTKADKPKSLVGKIKKLVKSKSIEESSNTAMKVVHAGVQAAGVGSNAGSDVSLNSEIADKESRGGTLKDKVKGMFKRSSRSPSMERKGPTPTLQPQNQKSTLKEATPQRDSREGTPGSASTQRPLMPSTLRPVNLTSQTKR